MTTVTATTSTETRITKPTSGKRSVHTKKSYIGNETLFMMPSGAAGKIILKK